MTGEGGPEQQEQREHDRLTELRRYEVLDTEPEPAFDELVRAAAAIARTPYAAVSLVDEHRQWFKAAVGLAGRQTGRDVAFCDLVVQDDSELIVADTLIEPRLAENPDVVGGPRFRFYAGFPLRTSAGAILGTLCVIDQKPGALSDEQVGILRTLADQVMAQLQLRLELRQRDELIKQRQEAFDQLAAQSEILEQAQRLAQVGSWSTDLLTERVVWSREAHRILGTDPQMPLDTTTFLQYVHPDDHALVQRTVSETFERGQSDAVEIRVIRTDGETRILRSRYQVDRDAHGRPVRLSGIMLDITQACRTQQEVAEAKDLFEQVLHSATEQGIICTDLDGTIMIFNRGAERILGYTADEMVGTRALQSALASAGDAINEIRLGASEIRRDTSWIRRDGVHRTIQLILTPLRRLDGELIGIVSISTDVTEQRRAESALSTATAEAQERRTQLEDAQQLASIGSWTLDLRTGKVHWSPELFRMSGLDPETTTLDMNTFEQMVHPDDVSMVDAITRHREDGDAYSIEHRIVRPDGQAFVVRAHGRVEKDETGQPVKLHGTIQDITDLRRIEDDLVRANDLFSHLLSSATAQAIIGTDLDGVVTIFNRGAEIMLGYSAEDIVGRLHWRTFHDPAEVDQVESAFDELAENDYTGRSALSETDPLLAPDWTYIHRDGHRITVQIRLTPMRDSAGQVRGFVAIASDVTEQRKAEASLAQARTELELRTSQLEDAQGIAGVGSWIMDLQTGDATWSAEMYRILAVDPSATTPRMETFQQRMHTADWGSLQELVGEAIASGGTWSTEHRLLLEGKTRVVISRGRTETDDSGAVVRFGGILQDVTDVRRIESELIEAQAMFNQVIEASTEQAIFVVDRATGQIQLFNSGAERMLGYSAQEAIGSTLYRHFHDPEEIRAKSSWYGLDPDGYNGIEVFLRATQAGDREWSFIHKDGSRRVVLLTVNEMRNPQGEVTGSLSVATDVTQARQAEREVQAALLAISQARDEAMAANQAKSAFLATMSHEIRTPMNAVIGITGLLLDSQLDDEQRDLLETVQGSGDQLLAIINDILDFSKIEAGDLDLEHRSFDLRDLVEGTVAQFAGSAKGLDLISHVDDACPVNVTGDVTRLRQVLSNLIGNAIKFTSAGDILVRVECEPFSEDQIKLLVSVRDTGIGIPEESMDRLFKSFSQVDASTTRTYGGTGLGLAISKALVNAMGGEIGVQSVIGSGSTFSFSVLVGPDDSAPLVRPGRMDAQTRRAALVGRRVLIVDDNATNRQILTLQLRGQGMETAEAGTPVAALQVLADPAEHFDLAIVDLAMPVLDGIQLAEAIHRLAARHDLPLLLLSSLGRRLGEDEQLFAAVLTKPVRSAALLESIAKALSPGSTAAATVPEPARPMDDAVATSAPASAPGSAPAPSAPAPSAPGELSRTATPAAPAEPEPGDELRILLAEDNEVNQKVGRLMLAKLGYQIDIVANGEEALAAAHERHYGVVLMDMHMPVMDGLEATRRIRAELPQQRQPRIVALTASVTMEDREACAAAGMDSYLSKPVRPDELAAAIAQATEVRDD